VSKFLGRIKNFINRQTDNFKALLLVNISNNAVRSLTAGQNMGGGATGTASYAQLYLSAIGANPQQLGYLNSVGKVANALIALPLGWISDRFSLKKIVLIGLLLSALVPAAYALSTTWIQALPALVLDTIMTMLLGMFITLFYITSIKESSDRGTAMSMRSMFVSIIGLLTPTISAIIVLNAGGITAEGIRPLFIIEIVANFVILLYAFFKLKEVSHLQKKGIEQKRSFLQDYKEIAKIPVVQKWTLFKGIRSFFSTSLIPFFSIYYVRVKGADEITLAAMGTVSVLGALLFLIPLGRMADKYGRKKIIYLTRPFYYTSLLLIILAPSPNYLILSSFLGALQSVGTLMEITMEWELVPGNQRGRLAGFQSFFWGLSSVPGLLLLGYLWERINPAYLLLTPIISELPHLLFLTTIPDTLHVVYTHEPSRTIGT